MNAFVVFALLYMIAAGWNENGDDVLNELGSDAKEFAPFIAAIIALVMLSNSRLKPIVSPFITLAVITTVLANWPKVSNEVKLTYNTLQGN